MRIRPEVLLLAIALPLVACKDYGEFTVAEREWVDNDELPALSEMDLTGINLEFAVGSEAHARVLPEVDWPHPVGTLMDRMESENGGELPADFDLPLEDSCIYVALEPRFSRFRRIEFQGRELLLVTYLVKLDESERALLDKSRPFPVKPRLTVIDESSDMERFDFDIGSTLFDVIILEDALGLIGIRGETLNFHKLYMEGASMELDDSIDLAISPHRVAEMKVIQENDLSFHTIWLADNPNTTTEDEIYYAKFDNSGESIFDPRRLSNHAVGGFFHVHSSDKRLITTWSDSSFASYGFLPENISKLIVRVSNDGGESFSPPSSVNVPFSNDDNAHLPIYVAASDAQISFFWGLTSSDSVDETLLRMGLFNPESMRLALAEDEISQAELLSTVKKDYQNHQRSTPVSGLPVPDPADCDRWEERLNLKPTGVHIRTPEGEQQIMKLDPDKNRDNRQN